MPFKKTPRARRDTKRTRGRLHGWDSPVRKPLTVKDSKGAI